MTSSKGGDGVPPWVPAPGLPFGDFTEDEDVRFLESTGGDRDEALRRMASCLVRTHPVVEGAGRLLTRTLSLIVGTVVMPRQSRAVRCDALRVWQEMSQWCTTVQ